MKNKFTKPRVGPKGQVVIPAEFRRKLGIQPGTPIIFSQSDGYLILQPLTDEYIRSMAGIARTWGKGDLLKTLMDMKKVEREL
ncbi:MAG: AbrB/MazE/SpoVT family DNA-binding domain-containing protein [Acidobacteria bacterium]|nr:AbrB/MazE/SpoVT family DNA-binding domain-containing protein [Acidobacteriota bacterium]